MEFTGNIEFADESSWLTLTTESDDTVTIKVTFLSLTQGSEVLSFDVTPNSGIVRLPAGEILRALINGGGSAVDGYFQATQGSSSCSHSFRVFPCRRFSYNNLYTAIFGTRPKTSPVYEGGKDTLSFFNSTMGATSAYVRFRFKNGSFSSNYSLYVPVNTRTASMYSLDVSYDTAMSVATTNGLATSNIVSYDVWIEYSGSKSETYSFEIRRSRLPLKTYKFLGRRGTYEYIHATGKFSRSIESETQVFVTSGIEQELENDSTMNFEQNSGHVGSAGMSGYWLGFLASKERCIVEKDGTERPIVVDEFKTSLTDRAVSSMTFKWHYANPNNTVIDKVEIALTGLAVSGDSTVGNASNKAQFSIVYTPSNTTQRGVSWSVVSGSAYASIDESGLLTVKSGANGSAVTIRATSKENTAIYAEKTVTVTYVSLAIAVTGVSLNKSSLSLAVGGSETLVATVTPSRATNKSVTWSSSAPGVAAVDQSGKVTAKAAGSAVITVTTNDGGFTATCGLTVAASSETYLRVTPTTVNLAGKSADGDMDAELKVESNQSWTATCEADWLDLLDDTGTGDNDAFVIGASSDNNTGAKRTTSIVFTGADGTTATVTVTQAAASSEVKTDPTWDLPSTYTYDAEGSYYPDVHITDDDNVGWKLVLPDWIQMEGGTTEGTGTWALMMNASENTGAKRTFTVRLTSSDGNTTYASCVVTQAAADGYVAADPSWNIATELTLDPNGGTITVNVSDPDNQGWMVGFSSWMTLQSGSHSMTGSGSLVIAYPANDTGASRTADIFLRGQTSVLARCTATQAAASSGTKTPTWDLGATKVFDAGTTGFYPTVTDEDNVGWSLASDSDWITVAYNATLGKWYFSFGANTGGPRTGTVRLGVFDVKPSVIYATCVFTQKGSSGEGTLSVSPATVNGNYTAVNGADLGSVAVTTDQQWTAKLGGLLEHVAISPSEGTGDAVIKLTEIRGASFDESGTLTITTFTGKTVTVNVNMKY